MANLRIPESKSKGVGIALLAAAALWFIFFWIVLLGPLQEAAAHRFVFAASFVGAFITGAIGGSVFAILTYASTAFLNEWWKGWGVPYEQFEWHDIFSVKSFWLWFTLAVLLFIIFVYLWRADL